MSNKDYLHQLVDELPDKDIPTVHRVLEALCDTASGRGWSLADSPVGEPDTPEEAALIAEAYEDIKAGRVVSQEDLEREFGLR